MGLTTKDKYRAKLLEYCGNPDNEFPNRTYMSQAVLGFKDIGSMYRHFTPAELCDIEREALDIRRTKYAPHIAEIDRAIIKEAKQGSKAHAELVYKRLEGGSEKLIQEHEGEVTLRVVYDEPKEPNADD